MINIERIVCPISVPLESDDALPYAVSLARAQNAELIACYCAGDPVFVMTNKTVRSKLQFEKLLADSLTRCLTNAEAAKLRWRVVIEESDNDVGEEVVRLAYKQHADLIVMRARRSPVPALLGSVAEHVSRTAACPVLLVRSQARPWQCELNNSGNFHKVLIAHDFSGASELALSYALSIALRLKAELHVLHVLPPPPDDDKPEIAGGLLGVESAFFRASKRNQDAVPEEVYRQIQVRPVVRWGKAYREILAYAREQNIDLICIGSQGRDFGLEALFGSNVDRVLRQAFCPVLVARPLKPASHALVDARILTPYDRKKLSFRFSS